MIKEGFGSTLLVLLLVSAIYIYLRNLYRKKDEIPYIRRIAGLDAIEEAVARATEMGKPIHASPGISRTTDVDTAMLIGTEIVGYVAELCARFEGQMIVTTMHAALLPILENRVELAFKTQGKEENLSQQNVEFITDVAATYVSGVQAIIERQECAANIVIGQSVDWTLLLFARARAIGQDTLQIGGTPHLGNCCHLIATCDYVVFGQECFAATAYITKSFDQTVSILSEDVFKAIMLGFVLVGVVLYSFGVEVFANILNF
jgi:hypothetical protein